jgi:hypothetical protein
VAWDPRAAAVSARLLEIRVKGFSTERRGQDVRLAGRHSSFASIDQVKNLIVDLQNQGSTCEMR